MCGTEPPVLMGGNTTALAQEAHPIMLLPAFPEAPLPVLAHSVDASAGLLGAPRLRLRARNWTMRCSDPVTVIVALVV